MAIEYSLILDGEVPPAAIASRAFPEPSDLPPAQMNGLNTAWDFWNRFGFIMQTRTSEDGYFEGENDGALFSWEPQRYTVLYFRLDKFSDLARTTDVVQTIVSRVLGSGQEDAAVVHNGQIILRRQNGELTKFGEGNAWNI
jgi:hypothetical protein